MTSEKYQELLKQKSSIKLNDLYCWTGKRYRKTPAFYRSEYLRRVLNAEDRRREQSSNRRRT